MDVAGLQDRIVELAKDLLMLEGLPALLECLDTTGELPTAIPVRFASKDKTAAFHRLVVSLHAARSAAEDFRKAHVEAEGQSLRATMDRQFQERLAQIEGGGLAPEDIESRRAS